MEDRFFEGCTTLLPTAELLSSQQLDERRQLALAGAPSLLSGAQPMLALAGIHFCADLCLRVSGKHTQGGGGHERSDAVRHLRRKQQIRGE